MFLDYTDSAIELIADITVLSLCLFHYINHRTRSVLHIIAIFLCGLLSSYYWTIYLLLVRDTPNVSDLFYYFGTNLAYLFLFLLLLSIKSPEERRYFHPLMLFPIPINIYQLTIYLPFGGQANSIYQVTVMTAVALLAIQSICWRHKTGNKSNLHISIAALLYSALSFGMWTSSCYDYPAYYLYYCFSLLNCINFFYLAASVCKTSEKEKIIGNKYINALKGIYIVVLLTCIGGGFMLGNWIKNTLEHIDTSGDNLYNIIMVILFVISLFIAFFAVMIIFIVNLTEKNLKINTLNEARVVADKANEAKSEFLANMSHEIRTPINAIIGMNEMILRTSEEKNDEEILGYAQNVESAGKSLLSIINDILDFSKIEAGKLQLVNEKYQLNTVINDVNNMFTFPTKAKKLYFHINVDESIPNDLLGDELRIRQIMINLLNNAVKYTEKGSITLYVNKVSDNESIKEGGVISLRISVKDTGIGIHPEDMEKLFDKFERVDLKRNSTVEGSGLGLAITYNLLQLMGGNITVSSVYGKGSEFTAIIPQKVINVTPIKDIKNNKPVEHKDIEEKFCAPNARLLLVDDTLMNVIVARALLKTTEITVDTASSGPESVDMAKDTPYDIILMDQRMPDMEGSEALAIIRAQEGGANKDTPVICLTADAISGARERYIAEGYTDYLTKPIQSELLQEILIKYLPKEKCCFKKVVKAET